MRPPRARVLALTTAMSLVALATAACTSGDGTEATTPEPFVPMSRVVETKAGIIAVDWDPIASSLSRAVRLDAETLEALPGEARMRSGGPTDPTGRWIAVFDPGRGGSQPEQVLVYDLDTWELAWSVERGAWSVERGAWMTFRMATSPGTTRGCTCGGTTAMNLRASAEVAAMSSGREASGG